jgi:hypothetical protein
MKPFEANKRWIPVVVVLATLALVSLACGGGRRGHLAQPQVPSPTPTTVVQATQSPTQTPIPVQPTLTPTLAAPVETPTVAMPEAATPTPTASTAAPTAVPDPLGDDVEAMLDQLQRMIEASDALEDLP